MTAAIQALVKTLTGRDDEQTQLYITLAQLEVQAMVGENFDMEKHEPEYAAATAIIAAAMVRGSEGIESFKAGNLSVKHFAKDSGYAAARLQAKKILSACGGDSFYFKRVRA